MYKQQQKSSHRGEYKKTATAHDARRRREDNTFSIRKNKREESLQKRRNMGAHAIPAHGAEAEELLTNLPSFVAMVNSDDPALQVEGTIGLRKVLSIEQNPPIDEVIDAKVIPRLVEFLKRPVSVRHQFEAAWALTNIGSGNTQQTMELITNGAVPEFVRLLHSPEPPVREQCVWALGNIAGDSATCRDFVMQFAVVDLLLEFTQDRSRPALVRNATWTISNFCRGRPAPPFHAVRGCIPHLARLLFNPDVSVLVDTLWALSYLSDGENVKIQAVMETQAAMRVVQLLLHASASVQTPALRVVGNIVTGDDIQTQCMINVGVLPRLKALLTTTTKKSLRKEACWTISNITAGTHVQIEEVIKADLIPILIKQLERTEFDVRKEAAWALANATATGTAEQAEYMVRVGCLPALCGLLDAPDSRVVLVALEGIDHLLKRGEEKRKKATDVNPYTVLIEECGGIEKLEMLQDHTSPALYDKAIYLIETYFGTAGDVRDAGAEVASDGSSFGFGSGGGNFGGGGYTW